MSHLRVLSFAYTCYVFVCIKKVNNERTIFALLIKYVPEINFE